MLTMKNAAPAVLRARPLGGAVRIVRAGPTAAGRGADCPDLAAATSPPRPARAQRARAMNGRSSLAPA